MDRCAWVRLRVRCVSGREVGRQGGGIRTFVPKEQAARPCANSFNVSPSLRSSALCCVVRLQLQMYSRLSPKAKPSQSRPTQAAVVLPAMWEQAWGLDGNVGESNITLGRAILKCGWLELRKCNEQCSRIQKEDTRTHTGAGSHD